MLTTAVRRTLASPTLQTAVRGFATVSVRPEFLEAYNNSKFSFRNFPVDKIEFRPAESFLNKDEIVPVLVFNNSDAPGLVHATPPAPATFFCKFGEKGSLGTKQHFLPGAPTVDDPWMAEQNIFIKATTPDMRDYIKWLEAVQAKYVEHLIGNMSKYKKMKKLESKSAEIVRDMAPAIYKTLKDENGDSVPDSEFLAWKQRIYQKKDKAGKILCSLDEAMVKDGGVRRHVPLYDFVTKLEIPLVEATIRGNDIVSVLHNMTCSAWAVGTNTGFSLRRHLRSVTLFEAAPVSSAAASSSGAAWFSQAPF